MRGMPTPDPPPAPSDPATPGPAPAPYPSTQTGPYVASGPARDVPPHGGTRRGVPRAAWIVALAADGVQMALMPFFAAGWLSPANDVLYVAVSIALVRLLGWHPALLPTLVAETLPGVDLVPTWTAAVGLIAWMRRGR